MRKLVQISSSFIPLNKRLDDAVARVDDATRQ